MSLSHLKFRDIYVAFRNRNFEGDGVYIDLVSIGAQLGTGVTQTRPANFNLSAYPNSFTKSTSVFVSIDQASTVKISIVDVMGKEVAELCNKVLPSGSHRVTWNASGYSDGVYFCKVIMNGNIATYRLVKLN